MKCASPRPVCLKVTQFGAIDGAMMRVVKAAARYEKAIYTVGERDALDGLVNAALNLRAVFLRIEQAVNDDYAAKNEQEAVKQNHEAR